MHAELGVMNEACLDIVSAGDDSQQARIGCCPIVRGFDEHPHFAADAFEARRHRQRHDIRRFVVQPLTTSRQITRLPSKQLSKTTSGEFAVDAVGVDFHTALQSHERRSDLSWYLAAIGGAVRPHAPFAPYPCACELVLE